jgi:hypothetical protein
MTSVVFDITGLHLIRFSASIRYWRKMGVQRSEYQLFIDLKERNHLEERGVDGKM